LTSPVPTRGSQVKFDQIDLPLFPVVVLQHFFELNRKIHQPGKK